MILEDTMQYVFNYEDVKIYDPCSLDLSSFKWKNGYLKHRLSRSEIIKPYLLSYIYYGDKDLWEFILLLNNIVNIDDMSVGAEIKIPQIIELQEFILNQKLKNG